MDQTVHRTVVISAVNIRKGGTLTVLRDCLQYLSGREDLHVTALVHDRSLCDFPGIRYIEIPWSAKGWGRRLWCEYVTMDKISRQLPETDLWFSLHDTTPRVRAHRQAVYCHTSFPFMKARWQDMRMDPKIPFFTYFTKYTYRRHIRRNRYLVVQTDWFRKGLAELAGYPQERIVVAPPAFSAPDIPRTPPPSPPTFLYPSTPDCHKNFETLCRAARILENRIGENRFKVVLTVSGDENRYAAWLRRNWGDVPSLEFAGFQSRGDLQRRYAQAACLVFPSRIETWGLPVSEFMPTGKPMILSDLPYAHEAAAGASLAAFFDPMDPERLSKLMQEVVEGKSDAFQSVPTISPAAPVARNWEAMFNLLLGQ